MVSRGWFLDRGVSFLRNLARSCFFLCLFTFLILPLLFHVQLMKFCACAFKVDVYCELLNEQISAERYRTAGAGCGRGDHTPFIREAALLSFRHSFALNVQVRTISVL